MSGCLMFIFTLSVKYKTMNKTLMRDKEYVTKILHIIETTQKRDVMKSL